MKVISPSTETDKCSLNIQKYLLVSSVAPLGCMSVPFWSKLGLVWFTGSTATVVDLNMGPEPGALRGMGRRGQQGQGKENTDFTTTNASSVNKTTKDRSYHT